jgi:hypothetical protein
MTNTYYRIHWKLYSGYFTKKNRKHKLSQIYFHPNYIEFNLDFQLV